MWVVIQQKLCLSSQKKKIIVHWTHHGMLCFSQFSVVIAIPGVVLSLLGKYVPTVVLAYVTGEWDL